MTMIDFALLSLSVTCFAPPSAFAADAPVTIISDQSHRTDSSRAATIDLLRRISAEHPGRKPCLFLETTPRIYDAWTKYKSSDGTRESFDRYFEPLIHQIGVDVPGMTDQRRRNVFLELQYFMASELRALPAVEVIGIDIDYGVQSKTNEMNMAHILGIFSGNPENLSAEKSVDLAVRRRNLNMCQNVKKGFGAHQCGLAVIAVGSAHVNEFKKDERFFPGYLGPAVKGVGECLKSIGVARTIALRLEPNRHCSTDEACRADIADQMRSDKIDVPSEYLAVTRSPRAIKSDGAVADPGSTPTSSK